MVQSNLIRKKVKKKNCPNCTRSLRIIMWGPGIGSYNCKRCGYIWKQGW